MATREDYTNSYHERVYYKWGEWQFFTDIILIASLVLFAGVMSGLTLCFMSMSLVDLEVLANSGTPKDRLYTMKILPLVKRRHLLLCSLLIFNGAAMEALPIFLYSLVTAWSAILISVTLILLFAKILPHSVCSQYRLVFGATLAPIVHILVWICFPLAYPLSKLLDFLLGKGRESLFHRAELKTLVDLHSRESGKGGELSREETTIIAGALELTEKTARDSMTPISETFAIDIDAKLDRKLINLIFEKGNSRVPVYHGQPRNIIGLILVKNLLAIHPTDEVPVKNITIRQIPRFSETMPLYDILNEFQKGLSHMAVVVTQHNKMVEQPASKYVANDSMREMRVDIHSERHPPKKRLKSKRLLTKLKISPRSAKISSREASKSRRWADEIHPEVLHMDGNLLSTLTKEGEVIGIITMQDVIEELLKEEIYDGTDHCDEHSQSNFF